ncbi:GNAT family N-acetyltransferase [Rhizobiaceae bacterium n13]|uniref:GNAT family N-acetyltransferase n=1 Tax=Ferirhizobium litorale TaxID=2927786 RepID=A0AAE3U036_9HYPH|nr:GNAT family N-acetyltransferase [Fererhizobium litorale]MDI7861508.1 GNAT family N-acetyltransferase [Fererhizobium litorale]MDI7921654.1 GNAT family N-acetyltransferase [Fererhizobium litorale]
MTSELIFRRATASDLSAIVALLADDALGRVREDTRLPVSDSYLRAFETIDADPNQFLAVAEIDGRVAGTLQLTFIAGISRQGAWRGQIEAVRVSTDRRGIGLGARMIEWAIGQCRARNCDLVQLTTDKSRTDAHRFYEKLGFKASHIGYKLKV